MPKLSIVIPTLNEGRYLSKLLRSIKSQPFKDYEIIVSDSHSKDNTLKIAKKFGCKIVLGEKKGPAYGRNIGAKKAKAPLLLFLDSDISLSENSLQQVIEKFERRKLDVATCAVMPYDGNVIDDIMHFLANCAIRVLQYFSPHAGGFFLLCKRETFKKLGGFDEKMMQGEDVDFVIRAARIKKFRFINIPVFISARRLKKEGRLTIAHKYLMYGFMQHMGKRMEKPIYEFGAHE